MRKDEPKGSIDCIHAKKVIRSKRIFIKGKCLGNLNLTINLRVGRIIIEDGRK